jgi:hypothetical protein
MLLKTHGQFLKQGSWIHSREKLRHRRGHDRMVVGFATTNAISAYHQ